jgi:hypothetical protein
MEFPTGDLYDSFVSQRFQNFGDPGQRGSSLANRAEGPLPISKHIAIPRQLYDVLLSTTNLYQVTHCVIHLHP